MTITPQGPSSKLDPFTERRLAKEGPHHDRIERLRAATVYAVGDSNAEQIRFAFEFLGNMARLLDDADWDQAIRLTRQTWGIKRDNPDDA